MNWRSPTKEDLIAVLSRKEVEKWTQDFDFDPIPTLIKGAVAKVRGYIRSNGNVRLSPNAMELPESCIEAAMKLAAETILERINIKPNEARKETKKDTIRFLESVAARIINPESYEANEEQTAGGPAIEVVAKSELRMTPEKLKGL